MATNNAINSSKPIQVALGGMGGTTYGLNLPLAGRGTSAVIGVGGSNGDGKPVIGKTGINATFNSITTTNTGLTLTAGSNSLNIDIASFVTKTSWTPSIQFGGGTTSITYTTQSGTYMRINNMIFYQLDIVLSNKGSSTGAATVAGLPVTIAQYGGINVLMANITATGQIQAYTTAGNTTLTLERTQTNGGTANLNDTNFSNTSELHISGFYFA